MRSIQKKDTRTQWLATIDAMPGRPSRSTMLPMCPVTPRRFNPHCRFNYRALSLLHEARCNAQVGFCDDPRALDLFITAIRAFHELTFKLRITVLTDRIEKCHDDGAALHGLIIRNRKDINAMDGLGRTPLVLAVECGAKLGLVTCLLNAGASPNQADARGCTPLAVAARRGGMALITLLIRYGASSRVPGWAPPGTLSPLAQAAQNNHVTVLPLLCTALAVGECANTMYLEPQEMDRPLETGLAVARTGMELMSPELRQRLLNTQAIQALFQAAEHGHWKTAQFLSQEKGIVFDETSFDEALEKFCNSPTTAAHDLEIVKLLYGRIKHTYHRSSQRTAPPASILAAIETGKTNAAKFLLTVDSRKLRDDGYRIIKAAIESGAAGLFEPAWERGWLHVSEDELAALLKLAGERGHTKAVDEMKTMEGRRNFY